MGPLHEAEGGRAPHDLSPHLEEFAVTAICSDCGGDGSQGGVASRATPPDGVAVWVRCGFAVGSLHISVDRSIYPRPSIDDRTGPENLKVEPRKKHIFESSHLKHLLSCFGARSYLGAVWGLLKQRG